MPKPDDVLFWVFQAFFQGKLKISGNMKLAMKLSDLIPKLNK